MKNKPGQIASCLFCLEKFLKFLNRNTYIVTAIYGTTGFITSVRQAFQTITSNPLRLLSLTKSTIFASLSLGKLYITAGTGILTFFFFTHRRTTANDYVSFFLIMIGTSIIATCFCFRFIRWLSIFDLFVQ